MSESSSPKAPRPSAVILRGIEGDFVEAALVFRPGFAVGPFSVGQQGDWCVRADGVASVHAFLWFDGLTLHAAGVRGGAEARLDGASLSEDWSPLQSGAELRIGAARVMVSTAGDLSSGGAGREQAALARSSPEDSAGARASDSFLRRWLARARGGSTRRRALLIVGCALAAALSWLAVAQEGKPRPKAAPAPRAASSAQSSTLRLAPSAPADSPSSAPADSPPRDAEEAPPVIFEQGVEPSVPPVAAQRIDPDVQRLERRAADAVIQGDFRLASEIYGRLTAVVPDSPTFAVAQRVSARKAGAVAPKL